MRSYTDIRVFLIRNTTAPSYNGSTCFVMLCRKVLKQIEVGDLLPDETVGAVKEARLLAKVGLSETKTKNSVFHFFSWITPR